MICSFRFSGGAGRSVNEPDLGPSRAAAGEWRWTHLRLGDVRALAMIRNIPNLPPDALELFVRGETRVQVIEEEGWVFGVLPDLERDLSGRPQEAGRLVFAFDGARLVTARLHPLLAVDGLRRAAERGEIFGAPAAAIGACIALYVDEAEVLLDGVGQRLAAVEDYVLTEPSNPRDTELGALRRDIARRRRFGAGRSLDGSAKDNEIAMPTFLHVGSGAKHKDRTTPGFGRPEWSEIRLDIDPGVSPDIVSDMTDMTAVPAASVEAVFSAHNTEHLYLHQTPLALREFRRVLKPNGFAVIVCPDLQAMAALIAEDRLHEPAYQSAAGGITPHDTLYGYGTQLARGYLHMAHRCGFARTSLVQALLAAGFAQVGARRRNFELWAVAVDGRASKDEIGRLMQDHFPA